MVPIGISPWMQPPATSSRPSRMTDLHRRLKPAALCGWLLFGLWAGPAFAHDIDQDEALRLTEQGHILPLHVLIEDALQRYPGRFLGAELERDDGQDRKSTRLNSS